jgi:hypothetical protein
MAAAELTPFKSSRVTGKPSAAPVQGGLAASTDATEGNKFANTGHEVLVITTGGTDRTITFFDSTGTAVGAAVAIPKEKTYVFGPFDRYNYGDPVVFKTSNADAKAIVVRLDEAKNVQFST